MRARAERAERESWRASVWPGCAGWRWRWRRAGSLVVCCSRRARRWYAREARLTHDVKRQQARWSIYRKCCWIFGCHFPHRGGDLKGCFLAKSADLSDGALERIRTDPPFNEKEYLGSGGFPVRR